MLYTDTLSDKKPVLHQFAWMEAVIGVNTPSISAFGYGDNHHTAGNAVGLPKRQECGCEVLFP